MLKLKLNQATNNIIKNQIELIILTVTLDVLKLWSLSEKLFHINLICPNFSSSKLLLHCSGFDWSDRSVQRQFPEDPLVETILKLPMDLGSSDHTSEVPTCTAPDLHHSQIVLT